VANTPELTIIVASVEAAHTLAQALDAFSATCKHIAHEIIVVDASKDTSAKVAREHRSSPQVVEYPPDTLVPHLWADGIRRSRGRWVALSTGHCVVPLPWATSLIAALDDGSRGAGAGLLPLPHIRAVDRAVFFLRYSGFLEQTRGETRPAADIPGDNAAYRGDEIRSFVASGVDGFWELEYHEVIAEANDGGLVAVPAATAGFGIAFPFLTILRHRFDHGRHFGAWRATEGGEGRLRVLLPSPLVPLVLLRRTFARVRAFPELRGELIQALMPFLILAGAWAAGEGLGALFGAPPVRKSS